MIKEFLNFRAPLKGLVFILAAFFIKQQSLASGQNLGIIAESSGWKALLYYQDSSFIITDPKFYLSSERTLKSELNALINELASVRMQETVCRFPARYFFLVEKMGFPEDPLSRCDELAEFKRRAPLEKAYVMFASENISIPSSMMGHIYLKMTGTNHQNMAVEHAISFYTDVDGFNFPKLVVESLVLGKNGLYALTPGAPIKDKYIYQEGRNVWEFELDLDKKQKILLQNHLYELKPIKLTYYFHTFNCATLIKQIIRVASPVDEDPGSEWTTPLDVIRFINQYDLIASQAVNLSSKWKIKSLIESNEFKPETIKIVKLNKIPEISKHTQGMEKSFGFKVLELTRSYNELLLEGEQISDDSYNKNISELNQYSKIEHANSVLDFSSYKTPIKVKSTAQVMAAYANEKDESIFKLTWLPASHLIEDDSSNYISESELQISRITLGHNFSKGSLYIDEFNLYSATSFLPSDSLSKGFSGRFRIGYRNYFDSKLLRKKSFIVEGDLGKTYRLHNDLDFFGLAGLNYMEANDAVLAPKLETGLILRAVYDMKSIISTSYLSENILKSESLLNIKLRHFFDLGSYGLVFELEHLRNQKAESIQNYSFGLKRYF